MDVMLSLRAHWALGDGVALDPARIHADFPVFRFCADSLREGLGR
jgi:hypothetical protein